MAPEGHPAARGDRSQEPSPGSAERRMRLASSTFVWGVWVAMVATLLSCIAVFGRNVPLAEDWYMVAPLTGHEPDLLAWLWRQNNEHRLPLPRLVHLGLLRASGGDFRAGMVFNSLATALAAASLVWAATKVRGRVDVADAFFPLVLLHLGHWINLIWSWQIQFVSSVCLFCGMLAACTAGRGAFLSGRRAAVFGLALACLPLCGANGQAVALPLVLWLASEGTRQLRHADRDARRGGLVLLSSACLTFALIALGFVGIARPDWNTRSTDLANAIDASVNFVAMGFGPNARSSWRLSRALVGLALGVATLLLVRGVGRRGAPDRWRALALLSFAAGMAALSVAIGWGRGGLLPTEGLPDRYALLAAPFLCVAYLAYGSLGSPTMARWGQRALLAGILWFLPGNNFIGFWVGEWYRDGMDSFRKDVAAGTPIPELAKAHRPFLLHWSEAELENGLSMLREAGLGPFERAAP